MAKVNLFGLMGFSTKANLLIIELLAKVFIDGQMEVYIKAKLKTASDMGSENIQFNRLHMKVIGLMARNKEKEKLYSKVEVYSKDYLRVILRMVTEKCIIILQVIILRENGKMIRNKAKVQ